MKYLLPVVLFTALAVAGCAEKDSASGGDKSQDKISFDSYTTRQRTKAGTTLGQAFNVEAFLNASKTLYFPSTTYNYSDGIYFGEPIRYWPLEGNLDFYAVTPVQYSCTSSKVVALVPAADSTFTVTGTDGRTDIMTARNMNEAKSEDPVGLVFGHKLTKVVFKAVGADKNLIYKIDSINMKANSTATYSFGEKGSWSASSDACVYSFVDTCKIIPPNTQNAIPVGDAMFLIPSQDSTVRTEIRYSIYEGVVQVDTTITPVVVALPVTKVWGINKSVIYTLTLNLSSSVQPVAFSTKQKEWDADENIPIAASGENR